MEKHAYCITVNGNFKVLKVFIRMVDNPNNDIFLLIDKKAPKELKNAVKGLKCQHSNIILLPPINIFWAGVSQIKAELLLLQAVQKQSLHYEYIHYMQGADLPLKTQSEIHSFFHKRAGKQFIEYNPNLYKFAEYKVCYYHFFVNNRFFRENKIIKALNHGCANIQKFFHWRRKREKIYAGSALFSITSDCAGYLLKNANRILKEYQFTLAADEVWIQTEIMKSPYREQLYCFEKECYGNSRYILWDRKRKNHNSPYTFKSEDFHELKKIAKETEICFARKFEEKEDMKIVYKIEQLLKGEENEEKNKKTK